jgi:hypothetical protein
MRLATDNPQALFILGKPDLDLNGTFIIHKTGGQSWHVSDFRCALELGFPLRQFARVNFLR